MQGLARRHQPSRSRPDQALPALHREKLAQRLGHGQAGKSMSPSAAAAIQKPGHGPFQTRQACKRSAPLTYVELPWPLPMSLPRPSLACTAGGGCVVLRSSRARAGPQPWASSRPWKPASTAPTPAPSPPAQRRPASIPASGGSVMTPCASAFPMPVGRSVRQGARVAASTVSDSRSSGSRSEGPTIYRLEGRTKLLA